MKRSALLSRLFRSGCLLAASAGSLYAADFAVTSTGDAAVPADNTLRWAVQQSNALTTEDNLIPFTLANDSSILLVQVLDDISHNVTLDGSSVANLTVTKNVPADSFDILRVTAGRCTLQDVLFTGGDFFVDTDAELALNFINDETFSDPITGGGALFKQGGATVTLEGANSWTGGCTVEAGSLVGSSSSLPGDYVVNAGTRLILTDPGGGTDTFSGAVSGEGSLAKQSTHDLTLDGELSYTGGTEVLAGRLILDPAALPGDSVVSSGATLQLNTDATQSFERAVSGAGALEKAGAGTLTLTGTNSYTGGTSILAGALRGSVAEFPGDVSISSGALLELVPAGNESFSNSISGDGGVVIDGSGTLTYPNAQSYTGGTELRNGQFQLNSSLPGDLNITSGVFSGSGSLGGSLSVASGSSVSPGSVGTQLSVEGNATFEAGSSFAISAADDGSSSVLEVLGTTTINGGTVSATIAAGDYSAPVTATILLASGGFDVTNNSFDSVTDNLAFLDLSLNSNLIDGRVELAITPNLSALSDFASNENQAAVANAAQELIASVGADTTELTNSLIVLDQPDVPGVLDRLSGEGLASLIQPRIELSLRQAQRIGRRFSDCRPEHPEDLANRRFPESIPERSRFAGWLDVFGIWGDSEGRDETFNVDHYLAGALVGLDMLLTGDCSQDSHNLRLGLASGYTRIEALSDPRMVQLSSNAFTAALYTSYQWNFLYAGACGQYNYHMQRGKREIRFESIDLSARSQLHSWDGSAYAETGLRLPIAALLTVQPSGSVLWGSYRQPAFRESKAEPLDLEIDAITTHALSADGKLRLLFNLYLPDSRSAEPELYAGYRYGFKRSDARLTGRFVHADEGSGEFALQGTVPERGALVFGGSLVWRDAGEPVFTICYDGSLCKRQQSHSVAATAFVTW